MKKEILIGILFFLILTPIFIYWRIDTQQKSVSANSFSKPSAGAVADSEKRAIGESLRVKFKNFGESLFKRFKDKDEIDQKSSEENSKDFFSLFKEKPSKDKTQATEANHIESTFTSPWKGARPTWQDKPIIGLKRTKLYYKPGDVGYYTYRNLKDEVDYFETIEDAEDAGYKPARKEKE